ncbi:MAG: site-specific integrase [Cyanobacteriota bacterium]|nr:site-specific integrase [Cyanobacteriota bacterium]
MKLANQELADSGTSWRLELRGQRLGLRGPLPPRPGSCHTKATIQRLSLGLRASEDAIGEALVHLHQVRQHLERGTFRWPDWPSSAHDPAMPLEAQPAEPIGAASSVEAHALKEIMASFHRAFLQDPRRRRSPSGARSTWRSAYQPYLHRLLAIGGPGHQRLDAPLLMRVLDSYPVASRSRQQCALVLGALAKHQAVPLPPDWQEQGRGYGLHAARFRPLPSDAQILQVFEQISNPHWRLVYGLMATYGLRNHEVFFSDFSSLTSGGDKVVRVLPTSKTGEHQVWPFQPEWVEHFDLERLAIDRQALPAVKTDLRTTSLRTVGQRVSEQFHRYGLPLTPYDLRHAWAVRTIHIGLPDTVAARMMGHSVGIHNRTYHHWITRRDQQQAVDAALARRQAS